MSDFVPRIVVHSSTIQLRELQQWVKVHFREVIKKEGKEVARPLGEALQQEILELAKASPEPALRPSTVRRKRARGLDFPNRSWWATGFTIANMFRDPYWVGGTRYKMQPSRKWHRSEYGTRSYGSAPITVEMILGWLEFGLPENNQVARPVFRVALQKVGSGQSRYFETAKSKASQALANVIMDDLRNSV
jgi:hypothetical protein